MTSEKTVLILGGGVGGLVAANELRKRLPKENRVVLIDRQPDHLFAPSLLWVVTDERQPEKIKKPLDLLSKKGIEFIQGEITEINPNTKTIIVDGKETIGDALVIALGADYNPELIPGLSKSGCNLYSLEGAVSIRDHLQEIQSGHIVILTSAPAYKCPAAPYETAMLVEALMRKRKIIKDIKISLYAAEPAPLGITGPELSSAVRQMVEQKGVNYFPSHQVSSVQTDRLVFTNEKEVKFDFLIYVPPHQTPTVVIKAGLTNESKWIPVDKHTLETKYSKVFAIGDITAIPLKSGKPLPKAGVFAHGQAEVVANNIVFELTGKGSKKSFEGFGECFIEAGDNKAGMGSGNFYAEPLPQIKMKKPSHVLHLAKVAFEKNWLWKWF